MSDEELDELERYMRETKRRHRIAGIVGWIFLVPAIAGLAVAMVLIEIYGWHLRELSWKWLSGQ